MERNSHNSQGYKLESQIRESFGRVTYSQTCHEKHIQRLLRKDDSIKIWQIILSALTTGSFIVSIISNEIIAGFIGSLFSFVLLIVNTYTKNYNLIDTTQKHQNSANLLWKIREEYVSLLTDFEVLDINEIMKKRDELQEITAEVYSNSPKTDSKSYKLAQKALKTEEEQTFTEQEIDIMLPNSVRRCNRGE